MRTSRLILPDRVKPKISDIKLRGEFFVLMQRVLHTTRVAQINAKQIELHARDDDFCPLLWLFNLVYGARMGNQLNGVLGNYGYDYRGGVVQLTGRANYQGF